MSDPKPTPPMRYYREYTTAKERIMDEYPMSSWPLSMRMEREADLASPAIYKTTLVPAQAKDCMHVPHVGELYRRYVEFAAAANVVGYIMSESYKHRNMPEYQELLRVAITDKERKRVKYLEYGGRLTE